MFSLQSVNIDESFTWRLNALLNDSFPEDDRTSGNLQERTLPPLKKKSIPFQGNNSILSADLSSTVTNPSDDEVPSDNVKSGEDTIGQNSKNPDSYFR